MKLTLTQLITFINNAPADFIEKAWSHDPLLAKHFKKKLSFFCDDKGLTYNALCRFITELSVHNQDRLGAYIAANFPDNTIRRADPPAPADIEDYFRNIAEGFEKAMRNERDFEQELIRFSGAKLAAVLAFLCPGDQRPEVLRLLEVIQPGGTADFIHVLEEQKSRMHPTG